VGEAVVDVINVDPTVLVTKSAAPSTLPEPGGTGTFTVTVTNPASAVEPIKLTSLTDSVFGSLNGEGTCDVTPAVELAPGAQYACSFTGPVNGNAGFVHVDEVTGTATDNENNKATDTDKAEISVSDVLPAIKIDKTAAVTAVHAGDDVTYTYEVRNLSGRAPAQRGRHRRQVQPGDADRR
jgi:hypothetical protein